MIKTGLSLTPIANTTSLLRASIEHSADNHESGRYRTFAHTKDETDSEEPTKAMTGGMRTETDPPYEDVDTECCVLTYMALIKRLFSCLIHFPTGYLCNAMLWGYSKAR